MHYNNIIRVLDTSPIIIGHYLDGGVTKLLLDRDLSAVGVAIHLPTADVMRLYRKAGDQTFMTQLSVRRGQ